jgi:hypothetical protein
VQLGGLDNLRRFCLADLARQTKAWYKGLSFKKDPPPAVVYPPPKISVDG